VALTLTFLRRTRGNTERNVSVATLALLQAKDLSDVMRLHREYMQAQMRALTEQASEMGQIMSRTAMDASKPKV
jgi:hypothetical protein